MRRAKTKTVPTMEGAAGLRIAMLHLVNAISVCDRLAAAHTARRKQLKTRLSDELTLMVRALEEAMEG